MNQRIQKISNLGLYKSEWGSFGTQAGNFQYPQGIAYDSISDKIYVADTLNQQIKVFDVEGTLLLKWGSPGKASGKFNFLLERVVGLALDKAGNVFVADTGNNRIQVFDNNGSFVGQWEGSGTEAGSFSLPSGLSFDNSNQMLYVADTGNDRIQVFKVQLPR